MKKISSLIVLSMMVTIGGVYATWNYAQDGDISYDAVPTIELTDKVVSTSQGTIAVDMSTLDISIDDANDDYEAELVIDGQIDVEFEADPGATADVKANGLAMQYELSVTTPWEYEGTQVFTVTSGPFELNSGNPTFDATISASDLMSAIELADISLPTVEDYDAFANVLNQGQITITISEAP